jgi:predicted site-specific integrase-resolvase
MRNIQNEKYFTPQETADIFGVSKEAVLQWIKRGLLKCNRISERKIFITEKQMKDYMECRDGR